MTIDSPRSKRKPSRFTLAIECENPAFESYREGEIGRILTDLGRRVLSEPGPWILRDANGNFVGEALVERAT